MKLFLGFLLISSFLFGQSPTLTAEQLLEKSIGYHDPGGKWASFKGEFTVVMESPNRPLRTTKITLDFPKQLFKTQVNLDNVNTSSLWLAGKCSHTHEGSDTYSDELAKKHGLNCERTTKMKNYYTYLYGLPMKLKDEGTILDPQVKIRTLNGASYWTIKVTYEAAIGGDSWYFYFDPITYQLRHYQFYHNESKNDGEYILLSEEIEIEGIKMPKNRAWYMNQDHSYLGTDYLNRS